MWQTRCRNLQRQTKELTMKVKQKDTIILTLSDQNKQLLTLNKDKSLLERANLQDRVKELELRLADKESEIKLLARRLQLESKSYKSNLQMEQQKYRDLLMKIEMSDFLTTRDSNGGGNNSKKQASLKSTAKLVRNLSPNRLTSKSATTLSSMATTVNDTTSSSDSHHHLSRVPSSPTTPTILPPCDGGDNLNHHVKKMPESIKNNSPSVNSNVQLMSESHQNGDVIDYRNEINLAKNSIDRSEKMPAINCNGDDEVSAVKNGMTRARRIQQQQQAKLAPINAQPNSNNNKVVNSNHIKNGDKKSSDDSELSDEDDDDDLHFFSNHNGTMVMISPIAVRESDNVLDVFMSPFSWS